MIILDLHKSKKPRGIEIRALLSDVEFEHLLGNLDSLCVFATKTIGEPASVIKTGARHSYTKYLLFPVKLRRQFKTDQYDFENISCGTIKYREKLYMIYGVERKGLVAPVKQNNTSYYKSDKDRW